MLRIPLRDALVHYRAQHMIGSPVKGVKAGSKISLQLTLRLSASRFYQPKAPDILALTTLAFSQPSELALKRQTSSMRPSAESFA
jgi:hypothetical protein